MIDFQTALSITENFEFPIGEDDNGQLIKADLTQINHLFVSGATGAGKSVFVDTILLTLIEHNTPDKMRLVLCDAKITQLSQYTGAGHALIPVCSDVERISTTIQWLLFEGQNRLKTFSEHGVKNLDAFNQLRYRSIDTELPRIVAVIDDLSTVLQGQKETLNAIKQLYSISRIAGIHIIAVTQTPCVKQTKEIASLFPAKITFLSQMSDLRFITGKRNIEQLSAVGDAWYCVSGLLYKVHAIEADEEDSRSIFYNAALKYDPTEDDVLRNKAFEEIVEIESRIDISSASSYQYKSDDPDELLPAAVEVILEIGQASMSMLQRRLKVGYSRAARLVDQMEERGYVGPFEGSTPRKILITRAEWQEILMGIPEGQELEQEQPSIMAEDNAPPVSEIEKEDVHKTIPIDKISTLHQTRIPHPSIDIPLDYDDGLEQEIESMDSTSPIKPTKIGEPKRDTYKGLKYFFIGISILSLYVVIQSIFIIIFGILTIIAAYGFTILKSEVSCPYCGKKGTILPSSNDFKCRSCKKISVRSGDYLNPVP